MANHSIKVGVVIDTRDDFRGRFNVTDEQCGELSPQLQVDASVATLQSLGYEVDLIGSIFQLVQRLAKIQPGQQAPWDLVFNVAEGMFGTAREAQVPALLEAYKIPFTFADAATMVVCMDKALAKSRLASSGVRTADFILIPAEHTGGVRCLHQADGVLIQYEDQEVLFQSFPLFVKPNSEGSSKGITGISKIERLEDIQPAINYIAGEYPDQGLLVEPFLKGREVSVGVLGTGSKAKVLGTLGMVASKSDMDSHRNGVIGTHERNGDSAGFLTYQAKLGTASVPVDEHVDSELVADAEALALQAHVALGLRDASRIDIRYDKHGPDAKPFVLEANTIPGLVPKSSAMSRIAMFHGMSFMDLIGCIVKSAMDRVY